MELFKHTKTYDFMGKKKIALILSVLLILASYATLATKGLNYGIDFAGGTVVQVKYDTAAPINEMRTLISKHELFEGASISEFGSEDEVVIRVRTSSSSVTSDMGDLAREALKGSGNFEIRRVDIVGPKVGNELREKGIMAMIFAIIGILIYVSFRFEWRFALASVVALVHDISIAMGAISLFQIEVNLDILAAMLTILGYSLNDTIIVFDRIREGLTKIKSAILSAVINESVTSTLSRTTLTSLTTFFVVLTLWMWGGEIIHGFGFTLLVGIIVGTYSSIFVASPVLIWLGFDIKLYRSKLAEKEKNRVEKERMRAQFEQGTL
ncbi:MAG: protein translocase subunit SecF [Campylobacterales bacterium]|nr:protein translocase subunit SecF [Campylobacterales bacterium]MBE0499593.1 protein translocase subunit SecF [Campylobacterales bacterium]